MGKEKDKSLYNEQSIQSLKPREFTRLKPGVYCGDTTYSTQLLVEILSNAIDEHRLGHGDIISIKVNKDVVTVKDNGQGFLVNKFRDDGKTIFEAAFSVLNTSGKYDKDGVYKGSSLGAFGIGAKLTNYLSSYLIARTVNNGKFEKIIFKDGIFESRETGDDNSPSGTVVEWKPDKQFFTNPEVEIKKIKELLKTITCLCVGLNIVLDDNGEVTEYKSTRGLIDLADDFAKGKEVIDNRFIVNYKSDNVGIDLIMTYTSDYSLTLIPYVNTGLTKSGPHIAQIKTLFTREFNKFFREKKWLKEKDNNLTGDDIQEGMYVVFNITSDTVEYDAQVKSTVTKLDMTTFGSVISEQLAFWLNQNEKDIKTIVDKALTARKAREAARKAKEIARTSQEKKKKSVLKFNSKLADATSKNRLECEIAVVEGDSAGGNLKLMRNKVNQAILPIRGKMLNTRKAKVADIQKNAEIMTLIEALGLDYDPQTLKLVYDKKKLRYGKIIIMADADVNKPACERLFA